MKTKRHLKPKRRRIKNCFRHPAPTYPAGPNAGGSPYDTERKGIKKGIPLYPNLINLKSNTMKNTVQK